MRILLKISFFTKRKARREGQTAFFKERTQLASVRTKPTLICIQSALMTQQQKSG